MIKYVAKRKQVVIVGEQEKIILMMNERAYYTEK